jgi:hypothetical protein
MKPTALANACAWQRYQKQCIFIKNIKNKKNNTRKIDRVRVRIGEKRE